MAVITKQGQGQLTVWRWRGVREGNVSDRLQNEGRDDIHPGGGEGNMSDCN